MPKLTLVKNPLVSEDKVTFISKDTKFIPFIKKFLSVNPAYRSLLDSSSFILRVNNIKIDDPLRALNLKLSNSDELVLYPNIQQAGFWAAVWNGIQAGAEIATTVGAEVAPAAGAGGTLSVPGTLGVYIGYGAIILGEFALIAGASYGINALFAPSMSSPSGPTEDSPTYGWNITPTAREGIPISVVYGEHMVGGNSIITAKEYTIYSPYRWMDAA